MTQTTTTTTAATFDPLEDLFATSQGLLRVWPINRPVVEIWRLLPDQWIRGGMEAIPIAPGVRSVCELLGLDPLTLANEGKMVLVTAAETADAGRLPTAFHHHRPRKPITVTASGPSRLTLPSG